MRIIELVVGVFIIGGVCRCTGLNLAGPSGGMGKVAQQDSKMSTEEVSLGLKEALIQGVTKGTARASEVNGYYNNSLLKILIPPEMQKVSQQLRNLGMQKLMDNFELSLNRGAEEAAKQAKPIFINAIKTISIEDAWNVLRGQPDAATVYLQRNTDGQLRVAFQPVIQKSLNKVNATKYYSDIMNIYNKIPKVEKVNPNLEEYVTGKAIEGLFVLVKQEEANIRENPVARVTERLKRVFSSENTK